MCSEDINECETVDCNNGTCIDLVNDYVCDCYQDYTGQHCNEIIDDCASGPCNQLNTIFFCEDGNGTYHCECVVGFTGQDCTEEVFGCDSDPCGNGGTCNNQPAGAFICLCSPEWTGMTCSDVSSPCDSNPCANGGTCFLGAGEEEVICDCQLGFTGMKCETAVCLAEENIPVYPGSNIYYSWPLTEAGTSHYQLCPNTCKPFIDYTPGAMVARHCQSNTAMWLETNVTECGFTTTALMLCEASQVHVTVQ